MTTTSRLGIVEILELEVGDRVRATLGESVTVGTVMQVHAGRLGNPVVWVVPDGLYFAHRIIAPYIVERTAAAGVRS